MSVVAEGIETAEQWWDAYEMCEKLIELANEKGVPRGVIFEAMEAALASAAKKRYGAAESIQIKIDRKSGDIEAIYNRHASR